MGYLGIPDVLSPNSSVRLDPSPYPVRTTRTILPPSSPTRKTGKREARDAKQVALITSPRYTPPRSSLQRLRNPVPRGRHLSSHIPTPYHPQTTPLQPLMSNAVLPQPTISPASSYDSTLSSVDSHTEVGTTMIPPVVRRIGHPVVEHQEEEEGDAGEEQSEESVSWGITMAARRVYSG